MDYTINEMEILLKLKELQKQGKRIELQLWPGIGETTINSKESTNRVYINEGRDGKWDEISESFYDGLVQAYDSRMPEVKARVKQTMKLH